MAYAGASNPPSAQVNGLRYSAGDGTSDTAATTSQVQSVIGSGVYDPAGAALSTAVAESSSFTVDGTVSGKAYWVTTGTNALTASLPGTQPSNGWSCYVTKVDSATGSITLSSNSALLGVLGNSVRISSNGTSYVYSYSEGVATVDGGFSLTAAVNASINWITSGMGRVTSALGFTSTAINPYLGCIGFLLNNQNLVMSTSKDGITWDETYIPFVPPDGGNSRDVSMLCDKYGNIVKYGGKYWGTYTASGFGGVSYFGVFSTVDCRTINFVANPQITGSGLTNISTTATASIGGTLTVASASGIAVGQRVSYPTGPGLDSVVTVVSGTTITVSPVPTAAISGTVYFSNINNTWAGSFFLDDNGVPTFTVRVSTNFGSNYGTPGVGYVQCTNPGTFTTWTAYTTLSGVVGGANVGPGGSIKVGSTWYLFTDEQNSALGNRQDICYYTSSSATGTYTRGGFFGLASAYGSNIESAMVLPNGDANTTQNWTFYFSEQTQGRLRMATSTTGIVGTYGTPTTPLYSGMNTSGDGRIFPLSNYDDAIPFLANQPPHILFGLFDINSTSNGFRLTSTGNGLSLVQGTNVLNMSVGGGLTFSGTGGMIIACPFSTSSGSITSAGNFNGGSNNSKIQLSSTSTVGFYSGTTAGNNDTAISRISAGLMAVGNGTAGDFTGAVKVNNIQLSPTTTSVTGSTSGTAVFSQPSQGPVGKMTFITLTSLLGTASYTYPVAYTAAPVILTTSGLASSIVTSNSATACTVTGATTSGLLILIGN